MFADRADSADSVSSREKFAQGVMQISWGPKILSALSALASFLNTDPRSADRWGRLRRPMPKHLTTRPPLDALEERQLRKFAHSAHAPTDWVFHAKIIAHSWDGRRTRQIADELGCHPQTVRERLRAFNERGLDGLGMKPGSGRRPRLPSSNAARSSPS